MADIDHTKLREYAELTLRKRRLDDEKNDINKRLAVLEPQLLDQFEQARVKNMALSGVGTVYLQKEGWARIAKDGDDGSPEAKQRAKMRACAALREAGFGEYVEEGFNTQSLSAVLREMSRNGEDIPEELEGAIDFEPSFRLKVRAQA